MYLLLEVVSYISLFPFLYYYPYTVTLIKVLFTLLDCFINYPKLVRVFNL